MGSQNLPPLDPFSDIDPMLENTEVDCNLPAVCALNEEEIGIGYCWEEASSSSDSDSEWEDASKSANECADVSNSATDNWDDEERL